MGVPPLSDTEWAGESNDGAKKQGTRKGRTVERECMIPSSAIGMSAIIISQPRTQIGWPPDRSIARSMWVIFQEDGERERAEQREEEEEWKREKRRGEENAINSDPRYLLFPFIHSLTLSLSPNPQPPISLCGTMTLLRDHIGGGNTPLKDGDKWISSDSTQILPRQ